MAWFHTHAQHILLGTHENQEKLARVVDEDVAARVQKGNTPQGEAVHSHSTHPQHRVVYLAHGSGVLFD